MFLLCDISLHFAYKLILLKLISVRTGEKCCHEYKPGCVRVSVSLPPWVLGPPATVCTWNVVTWWHHTLLCMHINASSQAFVYTVSTWLIHAYPLAVLVLWTHLKFIKPGGIFSCRVYSICVHTNGFLCSSTFLNINTGIKNKEWIILIM
jgi:hypothetical protein